MKASGVMGNASLGIAFIGALRTNLIIILSVFINFPS